MVPVFLRILDIGYIFLLLLCGVLRRFQRLGGGLVLDRGVRLLRTRNRGLSDETAIFEVKFFPGESFQRNRRKYIGYNGEKIPFIRKNVGVPVRGNTSSLFFLSV